tara:strand:- start:488 stop:688 length:201 start_codon:yes stop_codon:yes gene_type:complete
MDRARNKSASEANWATVVGLMVYAVMAYFFFADSIGIVYLILFALESILLVVGIRLLVGIARSRRT